MKFTALSNEEAGGDFGLQDYEWILQIQQALKKKKGMRNKKNSTSSNAQRTTDKKSTGMRKRWKPNTHARARNT